MHKKLLAPSLALAIFAAPFTAAFAANDGVIDITGSITTTTCKVEGQDPGKDLVKKAVDLSQISAGSLTAVGSTAGDRGFAINIGGNAECTNGVKAKVRFDPASPALDRVSGRLNIDGGTGSAQGVQIQMSNGDGTPIQMYTEDSQSVEIENNVAVLPFIARYYRSGDVVAGAANSRVGFQVVYD